MLKLAIVIPAYKSMYFSQALLSIANQTNKDFTLYIGDDCGPDNLYSIVEKYENRIPIVYKHFDENLGGKDLVAQWERCIDLVGDEEWIWLFSDDDIMDPNCVQNFYDALHRYPGFDLYHFNVGQINEHDNIVGKAFSYPEVLTIEEFLLRRLQGRIYSFVVEYIFRKSYFYDRGRFHHFDLAWGSDDATWITIGKKKGIRNIDNAMVYWRESQFNITPNYSDKNILIRKFCTQIEFVSWINKQAIHNEIQIDIKILKQQSEKWFLRNIKLKINFIPFGTLVKLLTEFYSKTNEEKYLKQKIILFYFYKIFYFLKEIVKKLLLWDKFKL